MGALEIFRNDSRAGRFLHIVLVSSHVPLEFRAGFSLCNVFRNFVVTDKRLK
jgi:hypothetical protein